MGTLQLQEISLAYGERDLLNRISCTIDTSTKAALAGANGSGKSTLLKIVNQQITPDSGQISKTRRLSVSYLPQGGISLTTETVFDHMAGAYSSYERLIEDKKAIEIELSEATEHENGWEALVAELHSIEEHLLGSDYYHREAKIMQVAKGLGFSPEDCRRQCGEFSGGYQMRIALGKILLEQPDILLLDEPTNYLDIEARVWLRGYLNHYPGGFLIVSHDRDFLNAVTNEVLELFGGDLKRYAGSYSDYERTKKMELEQLQKAYEQQRQQIAHLEQFIERFRYKASKAKQVQSRIKQLEKIEPIILPESAKHIGFHFPEPVHCGKDVYELKGLHKAYGKQVVIDNLDLHISKHDRIAVSGRNGMGKTTLLRILAGTDTAYQGLVRSADAIKIGYFAQDTEKTLDPSKSVLEEVERCATTAQQGKLRSLLGSFLFQGDDIHKSVSVLSGGEKSRLALLKILLEPVNVLILDEPTNHLDLASKDMLLQALKSYKGTLIFVSHDSDFIRHLATSILYLSPEGTELFSGDYSYFTWKLEQKQAEALEEGEHEEGELQPVQKPTEISRQERNRLRNRLKSLQNQEITTLAHIDELEAQRTSCHQRMCDPAVYSDPKKAKETSEELSRIDRELEVQTHGWEELTNEIEQLREVLE